MNNKVFCSGCGVLLQTNHEDIPGYILEKHLKTGKCQRCFKISHYSQFQKVDIANQALYEMIETFSQEDATLIHVIDLSDILGTLLIELATVFRKKPIILVVNKIDIIEKKRRRYDHWTEFIRNECKKHNIFIEKLFFTSAKENLGIHKLLFYLDEQNKIKNYIVGSANVGKSSLIQAFFRERNLDTKHLPTVFSVPGTTLGLLEVPFEKYLLYDTPGVMKPAQLTYHISAKMFKQVEILKPLKARNYQIYEPQTFFIGGYVQLNIYPSKKTSVTFYANQRLPIHRRKTDDTIHFFDKHLGILLSPPYEDELVDYPKLKKRKKHKIDICTPKTDIVISGLGWISFVDGEIIVEIIVPEGISVYQKPAII